MSYYPYSDPIVGTQSRFKNALIRARFLWCSERSPCRLCETDSTRLPCRTVRGRVREASVTESRHHSAQRGRDRASVHQNAPQRIFLVSAKTYDLIDFSRREQARAHCFKCSAWRRTSVDCRQKKPTLRMRVDRLQIDPQLGKTRKKTATLSGRFVTAIASDLYCTRRSTVICSISTRRFGSRHLIRSARFLSLHSTTATVSPMPRAFMRPASTPRPIR